MLMVDFSSTFDCPKTSALSKKTRMDLAVKVVNSFGGKNFFKKMLALTLDEC